MDQTQLTQNQIQTALNHCFGMMSELEKLYVICPFGIGDLIISGGLMHAVLKKFDKRSAVLIAQERFRSLEIEFDGVSEIKYMPFGEFLLVMRFVFATKNYSGSNFVYGHFHKDAAMKDIADSSLCLFDRYKRNVYGLPLDTPFHAPRVKDISDEAKARLSREYDIDRERTVILSPHANSLPSLDQSFWSTLVERLNARGSTVYTNVGRKPDGSLEPPLEGTLPMNVGLNEIFWIASQVRHVVGMRSGLFDLLAFSNARLFSIVYLGISAYRDDLKLNFPHSPARIRSVYHGQHFLKALRSTINAFELISMQATGLKHKYIAEENIILSNEALLEAILRALETQ